EGVKRGGRSHMIHWIQEQYDNAGIVRNYTKWEYDLRYNENIHHVVHRAFQIASTEPCGPVYLSLPKEVIMEQIDKVTLPPVARYAAPSTPQADLEILSGVAEVIMHAKEPLIITGHTGRHPQSVASLVALAETLGARISTSDKMMNFPTNHPLCAGLQTSASLQANLQPYLRKADVILIFDSDIPFIPAPQEIRSDAKIIHIDIDPSSISKTVKVDVPIVGQVTAVLREMITLIKASDIKNDAKALDAWWSQVNKWREVQCLEYDRNSLVIKPQYVIEQLYQVTKGDAYVTSDVGQHQMFASQYYHFDKPRRWINSGGLGTMGFGLPAAIGVKLAHPEADVACVTGEASIQMCIQELATATQYRTPVKVINLNNQYMGMVRQWQEFSYGSRYSQSYMETIPDFVKLAEAYGHVGMRVEKPQDVRPALEEAFAMKDKLVFMDIMTDRTENVYPMIEAGKAHHEMKLRVAPGTPIDRELA
ncbi:MAG: acetolactate synthase 3 large subunit, partial [Methylococcales bacterium]|nr:acetolactate synthase 3 large subunit [Methylococcales bacterium]